MTRVTYGLAFLFIFALTACQSPASEEPAMTESDMSEASDMSEMGSSAGLSAADQEAIGVGIQDWLAAAQANDWEALAATYTMDAVLMPPNTDAVAGRAAIQLFFETFPPIEDIQLDPIEIDGVGDTAYVRGSYTITLTPEGAEPINDSGKYLEIRRKQADGSWLLARDLWNSDLPLPD